MNIHITGRHVEITQGMRDHITEKLSHSQLKNLFAPILDLHIILCIEREANQIAEATVHIPHQATIHAKADTTDIYASIDMMFDKLKTQLQSHKEKAITKRDHHVHGEFCNHDHDEDEG